MSSLFIDSSSNRLVFALIQKDEMQEKIIMTNKNMSEIFVKELNEFLKQNSIDIKKINKLYVVNGPGNFTSLRIGCLFANTIKLLSNCQLYVISSCQFAKIENNEIIAIDAKSNKFYFENENEIKMENIEYIKAIAEKNNLKINQEYLNYDFKQCWKTNQNKFIKIDKIETNYIKNAI